MSGLLNKAKEMLGGGHHEETGNTNTHGSHHETGHSSDTTVGTTGDADKYASGYGDTKSANTTGKPMPVDKLFGGGHSKSDKTSSEYQNTGSDREYSSSDRQSGLTSGSTYDNERSSGLTSGMTSGSGFTSGSTYDNQSSGLTSGMTSGSHHHQHHHESGLTSGSTYDNQSSGLTSGMTSGTGMSSGITSSSHGHVAQEGTEEYERIRAEMAQHGHSGYGSGINNSVQAAAAEFSSPTHHSHHGDHTFGGHSSSGLGQSSGLTGSSTGREFESSRTGEGYNTSSSGGGLMSKVTGSNDRDYDNSSRSGAGYDNDRYDESSTGQQHEGGLKGMMNKVMGKDDTSSNTHGTHGSHVGTGPAGQPRNTDY